MDNRSSPSATAHGTPGAVRYGPSKTRQYIRPTLERSSVFTATPRLGTSHRGTQRPAHAAGLTTRLLDALQAVAIGVAAMPIKANRD